MKLKRGSIGIQTKKLHESARVIFLVSTYPPVLGLTELDDSFKKTAFLALACLRVVFSADDMLEGIT